ncbi:solute carrier family 2, facilitated glucose transporter member 10 [Heterodontus francisci]|uniref:solute carrier family 2, facilitated glucose transporter member 10 n=1 Tax=Heterodontus francisci TaxID=7792 RepID=UPI00355BE904
MDTNIPSMNWKALDIESEFKQFQQRMQLCSTDQVITEPEKQAVKIMIVIVSEALHRINTSGLSEQGQKDPAKIRRVLEEQLHFGVNFQIHHLELISYRQQPQESIDQFISRCQKRPLGKKKGHSIDALLEDGRKYEAIVDGQQHLQALCATSSIGTITRSKRTSKLCVLDLERQAFRHMEDEERQRTRNILKRQRKNELKHCLLALRDEMPEVSKTDKAPKMIILRKATEYVSRLKEEQQKLNTERVKLQKKQLQFEGEKNGSKTNTLNLNEGNYKGMKTELAQVNWEIRLKGRFSHVLLLSSTVSLLGGLIFGYELGIISGALLQLKEVFSLSCLQQEILVSALLIGAFFASLVGGIAVDYHGRRNSIILSTVLMCVGSSIALLSSSFTLLVIGRMTVGFAMSISSTACCIYVSEMVSPHHRGKLVSLYEVGITVGILSAYALNYLWSDVRNGWKYMIGLAIGPAAFQGISVLFLPSTNHRVKSQGDDSQKVLLQLQNGDHDNPDSEDINSPQGLNRQYSFLDLFRSKDNMRARLLVALGLVLSQQLTGQPNVLYYASTIFRSVGFQSNASAVLASVGLGIVKVITTVVAMVCTDKVGRRTLLVGGCVVMSVSVTLIAFSSQSISMESHLSCRVKAQVNGSYHMLNSSRTSSNLILRKSNLTSTNESLLNMSQTLALSVEGKQHLTFDEGMNNSLFSEQTIQFFSAMDSLTNLHTSDEGFRSRKARSHNTQTPVSSTQTSKRLALNWITLLSMMAFVSAYSIGFGPMTWLILSEIFPAGIRGRAFAFSSSFNWAANIIVTVTFLDVFDTIGLSGTFLFYGLVGFASVAFICLCLPETKGQSLEEIDRQFSARRVSEVRCCCLSTSRRGTSVGRYKRVDGLLI